MRRINDITYEVKNGENIVIDVVPTNFLNTLHSVEAVLDGEDLENSGTDDAPSFTFPVTMEAGDTHRVDMEFTFLSVTPNNACYQVTVSGENDVGCPCGFDLCKTDETRHVIIAFDVVD